MQRPPLVPELQLYLADGLMPLWQRTREELDDPDPPIPFWAVAWPGGQAVSRYVLDHREVVAGKRVLDLGAGSGLCAIAAMRAGAAAAVAVDLDPLCLEAVSLNGKANGVRVDVVHRDASAGMGCDWDVVLAGDIFYEREMAKRARAFLEEAHASGALVLLGDPGRAYFPPGRFAVAASYQVPTSRETEGTGLLIGSVYVFPGDKVPWQPGRP